jgi:hypothetical protein
MILSSYDSDNDDILTYPDFINMIVTTKDPILRDLAVKFSKTSILRESQYNFNAKLCDIIDTNLLKFFIKEISLFKNLNNFIKDIRNDYNEISFITNLFGEIDKNNQNYFREEE